MNDDQQNEITVTQEVISTDYKSELERLGASSRNELATLRAGRGLADSADISLVETIPDEKYNFRIVSNNSTHVSVQFKDPGVEGDKFRVILEGKFTDINDTITRFDPDGKEIVATADDAGVSIAADLLYELVRANQRIIQKGIQDRRSTS